MSVRSSLKHRIFRRLSESDMIAADERYQSHYVNDNQHAHQSHSTDLYSKYQSSTPATNRNKIKNKKTLKPVLKLADLIVFGICQVIGSGIYVLAGSAGKDYAGSGLFISFIIGGISAGLSAICYAEFASRIPVIGGSYMYTYYSSGEFIGFLSGFLTVVRGFFAIAGNAVGWTGYLKSFLDSLNVDTDKYQLVSYLFGHTFGTANNIRINLLAPIFLFLLSLISAIGIQGSANFMNVIAAWNVLLIFLFIISGCFLFDLDIFLNPCDHDEFGAKCDAEEINADKFLPFGIEGVFAASGLAFWAYVGLDGIASVAEESVNPIRDIPRAIYITLAIVSILYLLVSIILLGIVPFQSLDENAPLAEAFTVHNETLLQQIAAFGASTILMSVTFASLINVPRALYRIGLDGLLCNIFSYIDSNRQTPIIAIFTITFLGMIISTFFDITSILQISSIAALLQYAVVAGGVLIIRYSPPRVSYTRFDSQKYQKKQQKPIKYDNNQLSFSSHSIDSNTSNTSSMIPSLILTPSMWSHMKVFIVIWAYIISCLLLSFTIVERDFLINFSSMFWYICLCIEGTVFCGSFIIIIHMDHTIPWKTYINKKKLKKIMWTPFCPYLPLCAIAINSFIIANYTFAIFGRIFIALFIGVIIYFSYGYQHSKLNLKEIHREPLISESIVGNSNNNYNYNNWQVHYDDINDSLGDSEYYSHPMSLRKDDDNSFATMKIESDNEYAYDDININQNNTDTGW